MEGSRGLLLSLIIAVCFYGNNAQRTVCTQEAAADIVFLVDGSGSIGESGFEQIRQFLKTLVNGFDVGPNQVRIGLVQYSNLPRTEFHLNTYQNKEGILQYISNLPYRGGGTNTGRGLEFLLTQHFTEEAGSRTRNNLPQIAVVITDGKSQDEVEPHALELKKKGIILYAVGIKDADEEQLRQLASTPYSQHVFSVSDFGALQGISQSMVQTLCTSVEEARGQHTLVVQECAQASVADIVFLVDGSSSIGISNFQEVRQFLRNFIENMDVGADKVRVGLAQYSDEPHQEFLLKDYDDKASLLNQVDNVPYRTGGTATGKAISFLQSNFFTKEAGSRADQRVPQIAVVITDGDSSDEVLGPAQDLRRQGVIVFGIGVGSANMAELRDIANRPHDHFLFSIDNYQALQRLTEGLLQTICISMEDQRIALVQKFSDIVFLVDSGLSTADFQQTRSLLVRLINQLSVGASAHRIGLAQYSRDTKVEFLLNEHKTREELLAGARRFRQRRIQATEPRNLGNALQFAATNLFTSAAGSREDQGYRQFLVVVSGADSGDDIFQASRLIKSEGITVVGIGLGTTTVDQMMTVATAPYIYQTANIVPDLKTAFETEEQPTSVVGDCKTAKVADIVFIVDQSGSIGTANFQLVRTFLQKMVESLEVGLKRVRVGIVMYSDSPTGRVYLNTFDDKRDILQFIKILPYRGGGTNTGAALKFARNNVFIKEKGSRKNQGVQQVAVVITDGQSQDEVDREAADLRRVGVTVYAIGIKDANKTQLVQMASYPSKKHVFNVDSFSKLKTLEQSLQKIVCHNIFRQAISVNTRRNDIKEGCVQTEEADIFFLIDHSGSIYPKDFQDMKKFIIEFIQTFRIGPQHVRVGVAKYADTPNLEFDLTTYTDTQTLEKAVENIEQLGGGTQTGSALSFMAPNFERAMASRGHKVPEFLIVITDGKSADEVKFPAENLRKQGVVIYAIGVKNADTTELEEIAGDSKKTFFVNDFDALKPIKDDIITDICSPDACKDVPGDLLFLVDSSGSIHPNDYLKMKDFMKSMISKSLVGQNQMHMGIMQFSTIQKLEFPLNRFYDKSEMWKAIDDMRQIGGGTHTGKAIADITQYFDPVSGGRPDVRQSLIVITDGEAQDQVKEPAEALRRKGVVIYSIGVDAANTTQLLEISGTQDRVFTERDFDGLKDLESQIALKVCETDKGCKKIEIADIIFLVDGSTSITLPKFRSMLKFMESMVNQTTVGEQLTRFGVILYSNEAKSNFTLNQYYSKKGVLRAIAALKSPYGDTYTSKALDFSLQYFEQQYGGRRASNVPQILMVITDGDATDRNNLVAPSVALRENGIRVFSIGVEGANKTQLDIMAGEPSRVFYVDNFDALETLYKNISHVLCDFTKPACKKQKADLVMLIDSSDSIKREQFTTMKTFMTELIASFAVNKEMVRVGVAQFSTDPQKEFYLNQYYTQAEINKHILGMRQVRAGTNIGRALDFIRDYFQASSGSRIGSGISQNLVLITDGDSNDSVEEAAEALREMGIEIFVIGIGDIQVLELLQITRTPDRLFTIDNFDSLASIKQKVVDTICNSPSTQKGCSIDVAIGFDISQRTGSELISGQPKLQRALPEILNYVSTLQGLCCVQNIPINPNIAFRLVTVDGRILYDFNFEGYSQAVVDKVMTLQMSQPTYFNTALLASFREKFQSNSKAGAKVLVIFTDGLDEDVTKLKQESELLRQSGVNALLVVALEGVRDSSQLQMVEFGRGFGYTAPLSVGMQSVGSSVFKQIDTVAERECCGVMCKCSGHEGNRGSRGSPGSKGIPGPKGHAGFPGEEGTAGDRGPPGLPGARGIQGCPGTRGQKGYRGHRGDRGEDGDHGLDGINGEQGLPGMKGGLGERGNPGNPGNPGITGEAGEKGQRGLRGDPGEPGSDNTVVGSKGEAGNAGMAGDAGEDGLNGAGGIPGYEGPQGRRGPPGQKGLSGAPGVDGLPGSQGPSGQQGTQGVRGQPGPRGEVGLPGPQGGPGIAGNNGLPGRRGSNGQKGQPGSQGPNGAPGPLGPRGTPGQDGRDGYGIAGPKGAKGDSGFPGYPGILGESGLQGPPGGAGSKGNRGRGGVAGRPGESGVGGDPGRPGHRGQRGIPGIRNLSECQLITYIRDNCACSQGGAECPAYPTELVFGLDMSQDVTPADFERMRSALLGLLADISISESNCPTGARVAVVGYSAYTKYLIRFQDYHRKSQLLEAVQNIALERTASQRHLGASMRYVGLNVFKRVRQGVRVRKAAVFFTNGPSYDSSEVVTAVMEYRALNIMPGVVALQNSANIQQAFQADDTGNSIFTVLGRSQNMAADLARVKHCVICYDPCRPLTECAGIQEHPEPQSVDMDLAIVMDSSREVQADQYTGIQQLVGSVVEQLAVSPHPRRSDARARVAVVQQSGSLYGEVTADQKAAKLEFGLQSFQSQRSMRSHLVQNMKRQGGASSLGHAVDYALTEVLLKASSPRKRRALLVVVGTEAANWDRVRLESVVRRARCAGVALFVVAVGERYSRDQVAAMASLPRDQHLIHLPHLKAEEQGYAQRFIRAFLSVVNRGMNAYPPDTVKKECERVLNSQEEVVIIRQDDIDLKDIEQFEEQAGQVQTETHPTQENELENLSSGDEESLPPQSSPNALCQLDSDSGTQCSDYVQKWFYDRTVGACLPFWYGGCGGNANRFNTEHECFQTCGTDKPVPASGPRGSQQVPTKDSCFLDQEVGPCQNYTMSWFFDSEQSECSRFWFGGCGGNSNRFETQELCENLCLTKRR